MIRISEVVENIMKSSPFLEEAMIDDLINLSGLARKIQPQIEEQLRKEVKIGAIVMALKRYTPTLDLKLNNRVKMLIGDIGDITIRSNLRQFTYRQSQSVKTCQNLLFQEIRDNDDVFFTLTQGVYETTIIISSSESNKLSRIFINESQTYSISDLSSITLKLPEEVAQLPGIYYFLLKRLAWEGINIIEVISTTHEFTVVLKDKDINNAFTTFKSLIKYS